MDSLYLDNKPWSYIRFGIGILSIIAALSFLLADLGNLRRFDYFMIFGFSLSGLLHVTNDFGMQKTYLQHNNNSLIIKWINKIRTQKINFIEIESICLRKTEIIINLSKTYELNLSRQFTL